MEFKKCIKCDLKKCKAECCAWVSFNIDFLEKNKDKIVRTIHAISVNEINLDIGKPITFIEEKINEKGEKYLFVDERKQICPFLKEDYKCNIYHNRPEICKVFGTKLVEDHPFTCHYHLGKNYHFPDKDTPEFKKINNLKYFIDMINNEKLLKEMNINLSKKKKLELINSFNMLNNYGINKRK